MCTSYFVLTLTSILPAPEVMFNLDFLRQFSLIMLMGTTLRAAPAKALPFQQIIMHALQCQLDVDVHLLFCFDIDLHNLFPSSCITWIFFVDSHWWVPLCVQYPTNYIPFWQIIVHVCNAHMIYIYTYFVLTSINLICSCFVHMQQFASPRIAGAGHPCYDTSLFLKEMVTCTATF